MNHFGIAFGVIVAAVLGGAVVFDRAVSRHEVVSPQAARPMAAATGQQEPVVADTTTLAGAKVAEVAPTPAPSASIATLEARPRVAPPARSTPPKKTSATIAAPIESPQPLPSTDVTPPARDATPPTSSTAPEATSGNPSSVPSQSSAPPSD